MKSPQNLKIGDDTDKRKDSKRKLEGSIETHNSYSLLDSIEGIKQMQGKSKKQEVKNGKMGRGARMKTGNKNPAFIFQWRCSAGIGVKWPYQIVSNN